jgi:hypothetical protein
MSSYSDAHDREGEQLLSELAQRRLTVIWWLPGRGWHCGIDRPIGGFLSGSFNPLHGGHTELRHSAERHLGTPIAFELPIVNADKPALDAADTLLRCRQFDDAPLAITTAATFAEKAVLFPGSVFVVGADTAIRILDERFYSGAAGLAGALAEIDLFECRFLVAGRRIEGRIVTLRELPVPRPYRGLFEELPLSGFRSDLSSTRLRDSGRID